MADRDIELQTHTTAPHGSGTVHYEGDAKDKTETVEDVKDTKDADVVVRTGVTDNASILDEKPYSSFTEVQKWMIVCLAAIGAICSPISSNIYAPAIPTLADAFGVSLDKINLTVTVYLIFQALTPAFWGAAADAYGRRPVYIATIAIFTLGSLGTALCPTADYWLLMLMRIVQSSGASATIAVGSGITADVARPKERGKYVGVLHATSTFGPALGPLLGGVLAGQGWRSVFWFQVALGGVILTAVLFFLPETLRTLVGDGSRTPPVLNRTPGVCLRHRKSPPVESVEAPLPPVKYSPLVSFRLLLQPDLALMLLWASLYYALVYGVLMIFSTLLDTIYHYKPAVIGACYLANGIGTAIAGIGTGRLLDMLYAREVTRRGHDHREGTGFRLEYVRLVLLAPQAALLVCSAIILGWTMQYHVHIAVPLIASGACGLGMGFLTATTVFALDVAPGQGSAVTASFNLCRCLFGAAGVAAVQPLNRAIGAGWLFVLLGGICVLATPLPLIVLRYGPMWRRKRELARQGCS